MAGIDIFVRDTILTYGIPFSIVLWLTCIFLTDSIKDFRTWLFRRCLKDFGVLHDKFTSDIKDALFADISLIESKVVDLRNKGLIRILELGIGSGNNLKYYPQQCRLVIVDPNIYFKQYFIENKAKKFPDITLEKYVISHGENMRAVASNTIDVVVTTAVLCSVDNIRKVLKEIRRILVPGGKYFFLEHVIDRDGRDNNRLRRLQKFLNWTKIWPWFFEGCKFHNILDDISKCGFSDLEYKDFILEPGPVKGLQKLAFKIVAPHIVGIATK